MFIRLMPLALMEVACAMFVSFSDTFRATNKLAILAPHVCNCA